MLRLFLANFFLLFVVFVSAVEILASRWGREGGATPAELLTGVRWR